MANLQIIKDLIKKKKLSIREVANELGISEQGLQKLIRENSTKIETLEALSSILEVSISVFFDKEQYKPMISYTNGVPYYETDFIGGFDLIFNDQTTTPTYLIDFKKYNDADCWCNITGHSMEPEITHGDIIALKEVQDWDKFLPLGEVYAIVTNNDLRTVKRIGAGSQKGFFNLVPTNKSPEYGVQEIPINMIVKVFRVLGCMKRL